MRESILQTAINKFLTWLAKKSVTALYKQTHFWAFSWGLNENTDLYLMSEESYHGYHRFGVSEEKIADTPQTDDKDINVRSKYKQGTWLYGDGVYCSCCGYKLETTALLAKCPKCGADMSKTDCPWK